MLRKIAKSPEFNTKTKFITKQALKAYTNQLNVFTENARERIVKYDSRYIREMKQEG